MYHNQDPSIWCRVFFIIGLFLFYQRKIRIYIKILFSQKLFQFFQESDDFSFFRLRTKKNVNHLPQYIHYQLIVYASIDSLSRALLQDQQTALIINTPLRLRLIANAGATDFPVRLYRARRTFDARIHGNVLSECIYSCQGSSKRKNILSLNPTELQLIYKEKNDFLHKNTAGKKPAA